MRQMANKLSPLTVVCANDVSSSRDLWIPDSVIRLIGIIQQNRDGFPVFYLPEDSRDLIPLTEILEF